MSDPDDRAPGVDHADGDASTTSDLSGWSLDEFIGSLTSLSDRTREAYRTDLRLFAEWVARCACRPTPVCAACWPAM